MSKKNVFSFIAGMAVMGIICGGVYGVQQISGGHGTGIQERYGEIEQKLDVMDEIIGEYFLNEDDIDVDKMEEGIYAGYVAGLDEAYTTYYTAEDFKSVMESTSGKYSGIGAYMAQNSKTGLITFIRPFENGPAYNAGVQAEDVLYKVEGKEVLNEEIDSVIAVLKGEAGTPVQVTVYRPADDKYIDMEIIRDVINVPTVEHKMLDQGIGYIQISAFEEVTAQQFKEAIEELQAEGMEKLIFDLRDNGGGLLNSVCDILDVILPEKLLVYTMDKDQNKEEQWAEDPDELTIPMAVLVNNNTASASEIFTGALKDYGVAKIIGTQTFGKGIVQSILPLSDGSALKLTTEKYYTPSGVCIHGVGIEPDQVVELDRENKIDTQLQAAEDYLNSVDN